MRNIIKSTIQRPANEFYCARIFSENPGHIRIGRKALSERGAYSRASRLARPGGTSASACAARRHLSHETVQLSMVTLLIGTPPYLGTPPHRIYHREGASVWGGRPEPGMRCGRWGKLDSFTLSAEPESPPHVIVLWGGFLVQGCGDP